MIEGSGVGRLQENAEHTAGRKEASCSLAWPVRMSLVFQDGQDFQEKLEIQFFQMCF